MLDLHVGFNRPVTLLLRRMCGGRLGLHRVLLMLALATRQTTRCH